VVGLGHEEGAFENRPGRRVGGVGETAEKVTDTEEVVWVAWLEREGFEGKGGERFIVVLVAEDLCAGFEEVGRGNSVDAFDDQGGEGIEDGEGTFSAPAGMAVAVSEETAGAEDLAGRFLCHAHGEAFGVIRTF
jgi:hypothetical protein